MVTTNLCSVIPSSGSDTSVTSFNPAASIFGQAGQNWKIRDVSFFLDSTCTSGTSTTVVFPNTWSIWEDFSTSRITEERSQTIKVSNIDIWQSWAEAAPNVITRSKTRFIYEEHLVEEQKKKQLAEARAERLLLENLDQTQEEEYKKFGFFHLYVGNKKYRIAKGIAGNVRLVDEQEKGIEQYCIHIPSHLPMPDNLLAQKLMLQADPEMFLKTANKTYLR